MIQLSSDDLERINGKIEKENQQYEDAICGFFEISCVKCGTTRQFDIVAEWSMKVAFSSLHADGWSETDDDSLFFNERFTCPKCVDPEMVKAHYLNLKRNYPHLFRRKRPREIKFPEEFWGGEMVIAYCRKKYPDMKIHIGDLTDDVRDGDLRFDRWDRKGTNDCRVYKRSDVDVWVENKRQKRKRDG